jgi:hypothetical protein
VRGKCVGVYLSIVVSFVFTLSQSSCVFYLYLNRHSQMSRGTVEVFDKAAELVSQYITGCGKKYGMQCTAGKHCFCKADQQQQQVAELNQYEQPP